MSTENIGQYMQIGNKLKMIREQHQLSQKEVAKSIGVAHSTYSNYENGNRIPNMKVLNLIADLYHISTEQLLQLENLEKNRIQSHVSLGEIANELDLPVQILNLIENGDGDLFTKMKYQRIIDLLKHTKEPNRETIIACIDNNLKKLNDDGVKTVFMYINDILGNPKYTTFDQEQTTSEEREKED